MPIIVIPFVLFISGGNAVVELLVSVVDDELVFTRFGNWAFCVVDDDEVSWTLFGRDDDENDELSNFDFIKFVKLFTLICFKLLRSLSFSLSLVLEFNLFSFSLFVKMFFLRNTTSSLLKII